MGRFGRSWELVKLCWGVLLQDKELVVFPIVSAIAVVIVTASFIVPGIFSGYWESMTETTGACRQASGCWSCSSTWSSTS